MLEIEVSEVKLPRLAPPPLWVHCQRCNIAEKESLITSSGLLVGCSWWCPVCAQRLLNLAQQAGIAF